MKNIGVRLSPKLLAKIEQDAQDLNISNSELAREILENHYSNENSVKFIGKNEIEKFKLLVMLKLLDEPFPKTNVPELIEVTLLIIENAGSPYRTV